MALHETYQQAARRVPAINGQRPPAPVEPDDDLLPIIDWNEQRDPAAELIEGFVVTGRWTALVAGPKAGKSTLLIAASVEVSEGRNPFDGMRCEPVETLYIDAEMGRLDLEERLSDSGYNPIELTHWRACDIPPRLDTLVGGAILLAYVRAHDIRLVVIDGINGVVSGAEKDDTPWRLLYEHTIRPLKEMGVAVVSADNHGKDKTLGPRGSSVKMDKADAVIQVTRTDSGVKLVTTHRRTAAYPAERDLDIVGVDGDEPISYRRRGGPAWPAGTKTAALLLDEMGVAIDAGRPVIRALLQQRLAAAEASGSDPTPYKVRNALLAAAIKWRRQAVDNYPQKGSGTARFSDVGDSATPQNLETASDQGGDSDGDSRGQRGQLVGTAGGVPKGHPAGTARIDPVDNFVVNHPGEPF